MGKALIADKALIALGIFLWCTAAHAEESVEVLTPAKEQALRLKIESNWNVPALEGNCLQPMTFRVHLGAGGTVEEVKLLDPEAMPQSCQQFADSAKRAILISSPLPVPEGLVMLQLNFDPTKIY